MAYTIVNGNNANNLLNFVGITGFYSETLVNPYSGYTVTISGNKNINNGVYDGMNGNDTLNMTALGDVLTLVDADGTIMVKNVEQFNAGDDGDIIILAHGSIAYGNTTIRGSDGNDLIWANNGNDSLFAGLGDDIVDGGGGNDTLSGSDGDDYLSGGLGIDAVYGGNGSDTLVYSVDSIWSGGLSLASMGSAIPFAATVNLDGLNRSHDIFVGDEPDDLLNPLPGTDTLILTSGNDALILNDTLSPVNGLYTPRIAFIEVVKAGDGNDVVDLSGGAGHGDIDIYGGEGNDILSSSYGDDALFGDEGDDTLFGSTGSDVLQGGTDNDTYLFNLGDGNDTIIETSGTDGISFGSGLVFDDLTLTISGSDLLIGYGADTITIHNHFASDFSGRVEGLTFDDGSTFDLSTFGLNDAPVGVNDTFEGDEDTVISGNVLDNDTDADNDTLSVTAATIATVLGGTVVLAADGSFTYQGAQNFNGTDSFSYTLSDPSGATSSANVLIAVAAVNDAPIAADESFAGFRNGDIAGSVLSNDMDIDGDFLSVSDGVFATVNGGSVVMSGDGTFLYTPAEDFFGADSFDYTLLDGFGGSDTATVSFDVSLNPADSIIGTEDGETINGTADNDEIFVLGGHDIAIGGDGNDEIFGGAGDDILYGDDSILTGVTLDKTFVDPIVVPNVTERVNIANLNPSGVPSLGVVNGNLHVSYDATASITFRKGYAGYNNSFGSFAISADGTIANGSMEWANVKTAGINVTHQIDLPTGVEGGNFGFFIIADGNTKNNGYGALDITGEGHIKFVFDYGKATERDAKITDAGNKVTIVYDDGATTRVLKGDGYFTTDRGGSSVINEDGKVHSLSGLLDTGNGNVLRIGFEDLYNTGDADYEDVLFDLDINPITLGDIEGGNDVLDGGAGNDTLYGEGGNDILFIGDGLDNAHGGEGADVFAISMLDDFVDRIHDFNAAQGDSINIHDVLDGYDALNDDIADFVRLVSVGADSQLEISANGDGSFAAAALILGGVGGADIASMITSGQLVADQSAIA